MKINDLVIASPSLQKIILQDLPLQKAYELSLLIDRCNPHLIFYGTEELKAGDDTKRLNDLRNMEAEGFGDFKPIELSLSLDLQISAADIKRLEPLIRFTEQEDIC